MIYQCGNIITVSRTCVWTMARYINAKSAKHGTTPYDFPQNLYDRTGKYTITGDITRRMLEFGERLGNRS